MAIELGPELAHLYPDGTYVCPGCPECNPDCMVLNQVGEALLYSNETMIRLAAEKLLCAQLASPLENNRYIAYCFLKTAGELAPVTKEALQAFEADQNNVEIINVARPKIADKRDQLPPNRCC